MVEDLIKIHRFVNESYNSLCVEENLSLPPLARNFNNFIVIEVKVFDLDILILDERI